MSVSPAGDVSRSGRVRKKSTKLADFASPSDLDALQGGRAKEPRMMISGADATTSTAKGRTATVSANKVTEEKVKND